MPARTRPRSRESRFRLLYLGTDLDLVASLRTELTKLDYWLVTCSDRGSAILLLKSEIPYDLLLLDLEWRGADGLKLARLAHSLGHRKRTPIMLVTATELSNEVQALARRAGATVWATKTRDMSALIDALRNLVEG
jgi:DNA-binding response OmpR family regulator